MGHDYITNVITILSILGAIGLRVEHRFTRLETKLDHVIENRIKQLEDRIAVLEKENER